MADGDYVTGRWYYRRALRQAGVPRMSDLHQHVVIRGLTNQLGVLVRPEQTSTGKVAVMTVSGVAMMTLPTGVLYIPRVCPPLRGSGAIWPYWSVREEPVENVHLLDTANPLLADALAKADQYFRSRPSPEGRIALDEALRPVDLWRISREALPPGRSAMGTIPVAPSSLRSRLHRMVHPLGA